MRAALTEGLGQLLRHGGRLLWRVLSRVVGFLALGVTINLLLLWLFAGERSWLGLGPLALISLLALPAWLVVGYKQGIGSALDEAWRTLGAPLREELAARIAQFGGSDHPVANRSASLVDALADIRARLAGQRWIVRTVVSALLARLPFAERLADPAWQQRLAAVQDPVQLQMLVREQLDRIELPLSGWTLPVALLLVHAGLLIALALLLPVA